MNLIIQSVAETKRKKKLITQYMIIALLVMADMGDSKNSVSSKRSSLMKPISTVLVIYTGGTIGMKTNENGGLQK